MAAIYGLDSVSQACSEALDEQVPRSAHVANLLHRRAAAARLAPLQVPGGAEAHHRTGRQLRSL